MIATSEYMFRKPNKRIIGLVLEEAELEELKNLLEKKIIE